MSIKFYMNNPCVVIREVTPEFSEVKITPQFTDGIDGSQFCVECMVGNQGTPQRHTCDEHQDVIDAINDSQASIIVLVENRLLHDKPIEAMKWAAIEKEIQHKTNTLRATVEKNTELTIANLAIKKDIAEREKEIAVKDELKRKKEIELKNITSRIDRARTELDEKIKLISKQGEISLTGERLRELLKAEFVLNKLEQGGLDNWEWYGESYPSDDEINSYCDSMMGES